MRYRELVEDYRHPESAEFKAWFRNSVIVDHSGAPEILFHGTQKRFDGMPAANSTLDIGHDLLFATNSLECAHTFAMLDMDPPRKGGRIFPVYMRLEKPLDYTKMDDPGEVKSAESLALLNFLGVDRYAQFVDFGEWAVIENKESISWLKQHGYDGFIAWENGGMSYACFASDQIRSIFDFRSNDV